MFTYQQLSEACRNIGLNPRIKKDRNLLLNSRSCDVYEEPFDLAKIKFPEKELLQVTKIGTMIYNLFSQQKFPEFFNCINAQGKRELRDTNLIKNFLPTALEAQAFWFEKGLKACGANPDDFELHYNGKVYKVDHTARKEMYEATTKEMPRMGPLYFPDNDQCYTATGR